MNTRPFVSINMAMSVDGKISSYLKEPPQFTSSHDRFMMDTLRSEADALVVGAETVRIDNPHLHVRDEGLYNARHATGKKPLMKIIVTRSGLLKPSLRVFSEPSPGTTIVATTPEGAQLCQPLLAHKADIWVFDSTQTLAVTLLQKLASLGVQRVLLEGGSQLNAHFIEHACVDEICLTLAPCIMTGEHVPTPVAGKGLSMKERLKLELSSVQHIGHELYCRYRIAHTP